MAVSEKWIRERRRRRLRAQRERLALAYAASVRRMYEIDGMSTDLIAKRSGQPIEVVRRFLRLAYRDDDETVEDRVD